MFASYLGRDGGLLEGVAGEYGWREVGGNGMRGVGCEGCCCLNVVSSCCSDQQDTIHPRDVPPASPPATKRGRRLLPQPHPRGER